MREFPRTLEGIRLDLDNMLKEIAAAAARNKRVALPRKFSEAAEHLVRARQAVGLARSILMNGE